MTAEHAIEYRVETERVVREERSGSKVLQRESYVLPPGMCACLELECGTGLQPVESEDWLKTHPASAGRADDLPGGPANRPAMRAVLRIIPRTDVPRDPKAQPLRIEAAVGTDNRFQQRKGT